MIKITENTCNQIINAFCKNRNDYQDDGFEQSCQLSRHIFSQGKAHLEVMMAQKEDSGSTETDRVSSVPMSRLHH